MLYTAKYRAQDGTLKEISVDATDRSDAIVQLNNKRIHPITLKKSDKKREQQPYNHQSILHSKLVNWAIVFILTALAIVFIKNFLSGEGSKNSKPANKTYSRIEKKPNIALTNKVVNVKKTKPTAPPSKADSCNFGMTEIERRRWEMTNGCLVVSRAKPIHQNATEQMLDFIFNTEVGLMPPPCPKLPKHELKNIQQILDTALTSSDEDDETLAERKETIELAKKELKDYLSQGGTPDEFFTYYHAQLMKAFNERQMMQTAVVKIAQEDPIVAKEYLEEVNASLRDKGIKEIHVPRKIAECLGLSDALDSNMQSSDKKGKEK